MLTVLLLLAWAERCVHSRVCTYWRRFVCLGLQNINELQHPKKIKHFLSTWYRSQLYHVACMWTHWNEISKGEQGLVKRQQTAVDSNVFPIIPQSHFEDRLSWTNSVPRLRCTKVPWIKKRPNAPEVKKSFNQVASIILRRFLKWLLLLWWPHQFCCQSSQLSGLFHPPSWLWQHSRTPFGWYHHLAADTTSKMSSHSQLKYSVKAAVH